MGRRKGKHYPHIMDYIDRATDGHGDYGAIIQKLRNHPPGYRRTFCIYFSDADIDNGGFLQYYTNCFGCMTVSAIEGYERLGAKKMVAVMKSALKVCLQLYPDVAAHTDFTDVPPNYLADFEAVACSFPELDAMYYEEADRLPGAADSDSNYPVGVIDYYFEHFPEDF